MTPSKIVIVGGGLAAASAAEDLRSEGYAGAISMIGAEPVVPYHRPPLSKGFLQGEATFESAYVHPEHFYEEHAIDLLLSTKVTRVDPSNSQVETDSGRRIAYDRLLLAPGSYARRISIPGSDLDGVQYLRDVADARAIKEGLQRGRHVTIVGAGWIGCEVAASARKLGVDVTVIDPLSVPLERVLGPEVGTLWRDLHTSHGVQMLLGTGVTAFEGEGRVERVVLSDGRSIDTDLVVVGIGVMPAVEFTAGVVELDNGILVDELLQTSTTGIFAAGDAANAAHPLFARRLRVEHWATARDHGRAAARSMLGTGTPYDAIPSFYSDQYDLSLQYWGHATSWDQVVVRGSLEDEDLLAFWLQDGRVLAGMAVGIPDAGDQVQQLIRSQAPVDLDQLRDADTPLSDVATNAHEASAVKEFVTGGVNYTRRFVRGRFGKADSSPVSDLSPGDGKVLQVDGDKLAVYRDEAGELHALSPVCTHLGCLVEWNPGDKVWDCPCHNARFARDGKVLRGPATKDLPKKQLPTKETPPTR